MVQKDWFILKTESQLKKLQRLLEEYPFIELGGESVYVRLGYKNLTPGDKETYFLMRDLTLFSRYKYGLNKIEPSLDYLATCLGTSINTQLARINNLEEVELIKRTKRKYKTNIYLVNVQPLPDSTFVKTLISLIRRKKVLNLVDNYKNTCDTFEKSNIVNELNTLNDSFFYKNIIEHIPRVKNILKEHSKSLH